MATTSCLQSVGGGSDARRLPRAPGDLYGRAVRCGANYSLALTRASREQRSNSKTLCPSGLRGWTQVPLARAAWVQIPQVSFCDCQVLTRCVQVRHRNAGFGSAPFRSDYSAPFHHPARSLEVFLSSMANVLIRVHPRRNTLGCICPRSTPS